jgi:hypothetical protein
MRSIRRVILPLLIVIVAAVGVAIYLTSDTGRWVLTRSARVTGTVTRDGKPIEWTTEYPRLLVLFAPLDPAIDPEVYRAETDTQAGTYALERLPIGTYRVSIQFMDPEPVNDQLQFTYGLNNSPEIHTIGGDTVLDIDIPKVLPKAPGPPKMPMGGPDMKMAFGKKGRPKKKEPTEPKEPDDSDPKATPEAIPAPREAPDK